MTCPPPTQWLPAREAAPLLGIPRGSLDRKGRLGKLPRRKCPERDVWLYECPGELAEDVEEPAPPFLMETHKRYVFVRDHDGERYVIAMRRLGENVPFDASWINDLIYAYSNEGGGQSVENICRQFEISRATFLDIQAALGFTHTSPPWSRERIAETDEETLVHDALMAKVQRVRLRSQRLAWRRTEEDALKWRQGPAAMLEAVERLAPHLSRPPLPRPAKSSSPEPFSILLGCSDMHVGKRAACRPPLAPEAQAEYLERLALRAIEVALRWGAPERWYVHVGGDLLHVDNRKQETTSGTPQGAQTTGSTGEIWWASYYLMERIIERCAQLAPVVAPTVPGNHDKMLAFTVGAALKIRFRNAEHVTVDVGKTSDETWRVYGVDGVPLLLDHGHKIKPARYPGLLARHLPRGCDINKGLAFRGHFHEAAMTPIDGVQVITMPSPGCWDDWHRESGYLHRGAMGTYKIGRQGLDASAWVYREDG